MRGSLDPWITGLLLRLAKHVMDMVCAVSLCKSPSPANSWLWPFGYPSKPAHAISGTNPNKQSALIVSGEITHSCSFSEVILSRKKLGKKRRSLRVPWGRLSRHPPTCPVPWTLSGARPIPPTARSARRCLRHEGLLPKIVSLLSDPLISSLFTK